jgi:hypothetical protein
VLASELDRIQKRPDKIPFNSATVVEKDFGFMLPQSVEERHSFEAQGPRRKAMGKARNYLLSAAMKPHHSWVYWRDVDIVDSPKKILEDFMAHNRDVLVPSKRRSSLCRMLCTNKSKISGSTGTKTIATLKADVGSLSRIRAL